MKRKPINDFYIQQAISQMPFVPDSTDEVISWYRGHYKNYLYTAWWQHLNDQLIRSNPNAKCWISGKLSSLLIHHIRYDNLFHEKLYRDVYVLNFDTHSQVHFYKVLFFFTRKTKLTKHSLLKRMRFLKMCVCIRNKQFGLAVWYNLRYITTL